MHEIRIRPAQVQDMPGIMALIHELATYEKAPQEVTNTIAQLEHDFANGYFSCLVAEEVQTNQIVGMLLYCFPYSTWKGRVFYIDDIVVKESYRGRGIGTKLFEKALEIAKAGQFKRIAWQVLNWNRPAIQFYKNYPVRFDSDWVNCHLYLDDLRNEGSA
jgi:ribosomal protein S18 acetylase RimI-like enzyme